MAYVLEVDWNNDGDFGDTGEDVTADVLSVECRRGRDFASQLVGRSTAGQLRAELVNSTGKYSPFNTSGPLYGNLVPGRKVRLRSTTPETTLWTGYIDRIEPRTVLGPVARATLYAAGPLVRLTGQRVNPAASSGALTGSLVTVVMQAAGLAAADYDIDPGVSTTSRWFIEDKDALEAVRELEETELGFLYEHPDGRLRFEDRHARLTQSRSLVSQATFSDHAGASLRYREIEEADPLRQIFNECVATVTPYTVGSVAVLWTYSGSSPVLAPGQSQTFIAQYPNDSSGGAQGAYVDAWTTPDSSDITVTGAAFGNLGISVVKSARRMEITITNNHASASATLTLLRARGTPVTKGNPTSVKASDATSQAAYGRRSYTLPGPWLASVNDAQAFVDYVVSRYKDPLAVVSIGIPTSKGAAYLEQAVTRQISDRITLEADSMGIAADFFIEAIAHRITNGGLRHETTFELSPTEGDSGYWVLGTSLLGTDTRLAY